MKNVLFAIVVVVVAIASTACGSADISDAFQNVLETNGVAAILDHPDGRKVYNDDFFVVCSQSGTVGVAKIDTSADLAHDVTVRWIEIESEAACGVKLDDLITDHAHLGILKNMIKGGGSLENLKSEMRDIEVIESRRQ